MTTPTPDKLAIPEAAVEALYEFLREACWPMTKADRVTLRDGLAAAILHMPDRGYAEGIEAAAKGIKLAEQLQNWRAHYSLSTQEKRLFDKIDLALRSALIASPALADNGDPLRKIIDDAVIETAARSPGRRGPYVFDEAELQANAAARATLSPLEDVAEPSVGVVDVIAEAMWRSEANGSRSFEKARAASNWNDQLPETIGKWRHFARAALFAARRVRQAEPIEAARHECARSGPCSENGDGCTCSDKALAARRVRPSPVDEDARDGVLEEVVKLVEGFTPVLPELVTEDEGGQKWVTPPRQEPIYNPEKLVAAIRALQSQRKG